jgi:hypothetical protein
MCAQLSSHSVLALTNARFSQSPMFSNSTAEQPIQITVTAGISQSTSNSAAVSEAMTRLNPDHSPSTITYHLHSPWTSRKSTNTGKHALGVARISNTSSRLGSYATRSPTSSSRNEYKYTPVRTLSLLQHAWKTSQENTCVDK